MKEIYRLHLHMRKVLTKFLIPQTLLANWGSYITHTSKYNQERFNFEEAPSIIEAGRLFNLDFLCTVRCKHKFPVRVRRFVDIYIRLYWKNLLLKYCLNFIEFGYSSCISLVTCRIQWLFEHTNQDFHSYLEFPVYNVREYAGKQTAWWGSKMI